MPHVIDQERIPTLPRFLDSPLGGETPLGQQTHRATHVAASGEGGGEQPGFVVARDEEAVADEVGGVLGSGGHHADGVRQVLVLHPHGVGRSAGGCQVDGGNCCDRLADIADLAVLAEQVDDGSDAGHLESAAGVDCLYVGTRARRPNDATLQLTVELDVDGESGRTGGLGRSVRPHRSDRDVHTAGGCCPDRLDDSRVGATPTELAVQCPSDGIAVRSLVAVLFSPAGEKRLPGQHHSWGTEPALDGIVGDHCSLESRELATLPQTLDGDHRAVRQLGSGQGASLDGGTIDQDDARSTPTATAGVLGSGETEGVPDQVESGAGGRVEVHRPSVERECDFGHGATIGLCADACVLGTGPLPVPAPWLTPRGSTGPFPLPFGKGDNRIRRHAAAGFEPLSGTHTASPTGSSTLATCTRRHGVRPAGRTGSCRPRPASGVPRSDC